MIPLPNDKFWTNRFTEVQLPTKRQIFARTGERAVSPAGEYTKDEPARFGKTPTESASEFVKSAESFDDFPVEDVE